MFVHSFESSASLDGPGVRLVIFLAGCPLRCAYCHNPDMQTTASSMELTTDEVINKILRHKPYFQSGGVTFSGGEPLLQSSDILTIMKKLESEIRFAIDTSGCVMNESVKELLSHKPLLLLDIKMPDEARHEKYIKGSLQSTLNFLKEADEQGCKIWLRYVVLPSINDSESDIEFIVNLAKTHKNVEKITLLPYHKMGVYKYEKLNIPYTLDFLLEPTDEHMSYLNSLIPSEYK